MTEFGRVITQNEHNLHNGNFQFIESAAQILRRNKQRIAFREKRTIYMENPLKSYDFSGFSGPSDWFRTSGLVVPNRNRKLFWTFLTVFYRFHSYSVTLVPSFEPPFPPVPRASVVIHVVKKRFPLKRTGSVSAFIICPYPKKYCFISEMLPSLSQNHS